jgi:nitrogen regulatory protein PII
VAATCPSHEDKRSLGVSSTGPKTLWRGGDTLRGMKLVIGIVRPEKANEVLEALYRAEVRGFSMSHVQGHGGELDRVETYRGTTVRVGMSDKVLFEIAVSDEFVEPTIEALCDGGRTGEVGDGKIFVLELEQVVRIRTGEIDNAAVTPVGA